jgi:hypothetical protein
MKQCSIFSYKTVVSKANSHVEIFLQFPGNDKKTNKMEQVAQPTNPESIGGYVLSTTQKLTK